MAPVVGFVGAYLVDRVLLVAETVRAEFVRFSPPRRRYRFDVVHAGVDVAEPVARSPNTVGVIARLVERKGHEVLLRAWAVAKADERAAAWHLELWGDGPQRGAIEQQISALGLGETVTLSGAVMNASTKVGCFPIVVLPSHREGLPLTLMEAMAAGCAVVATDLPGTRELVGDAGVLVNPNDAAGLAAALLALLDDAERREVLGSHARARIAAQFSRARMVDAYREALMG